MTGKLAESLNGEPVHVLSIPMPADNCTHGVMAALASRYDTFID
jgi:hypothetical protein